MLKNLFILIIVITSFRFSFSQELFPDRNHEKKYGFVDEAGNVVIGYQFESADDFYEGLAAVKKDGLYGFINQNGDIVIDFEYLKAYYFAEGLCPVKKGNNWIYINKKGKKAIRKKFDQAYSFSEGLAATCIRDKWGFINVDGDVVIDHKFQGAWNFSQGLANVKKDGLWGYIDKSGNTAIGFSFDMAYSFIDTFAIVIINNRQLFINKNGEFIGDYEERVYELAETMPKYPGGMVAMNEFIQMNLNYPKSVHESGIDDVVLIQVIVTKDGSLRDIEVIKSLGEELDLEAKKVVNKMPKWIPGKIQGQPVNVIVQIPVKFTLIH